MRILESWIRERLIGFPDGLLRVLSAAVLARRSVLILSEHGTGKTTFCSLVARFLGIAPTEWAYYDATKDDIVSVAGIPNAQAMQEGRLEFAEHERSIWNKKIVLIDEITRAPPENQNLWLEIVDQRSLFGRPLEYRFLVATCNPSEYASAFELDVALLDRFSIVCRFPNLRDATESLLAQVVMANIGHARQRDESATHPPVGVVELFDRFEAARRNLVRNCRLTDQVAKWCARLVHSLHVGSQTELRISNRTLGVHLPNVLLDLLAYDNVVRSNMGVERQAALAAYHVLKERHEFDDLLFDTCLSEAVPLIASLAPESDVDAALRILSLVSRSGSKQHVRSAIETLRNATLEDYQRSRLDILIRNITVSCRGDADTLSYLAGACRDLTPLLVPELEIAATAAKVEKAVNGDNVNWAL